MKTRALIFAALLASPLAAQETPPLLEVNLDPYLPPAVWVTQVNTTWINALEMRITAREGGWVLPALDAFANHEGAPSWLAVPSPTSFSTLNYPGIKPYVSGQSVKLSQPSFDYLLRCGFRNVVPPHPLDADYICNFYVPLLSGGGSRVWHSSPPVWVEQLGPHALISRIQWESMNSEFINNTSYAQPTRFSTESMLRWAIMLRAITSAAPPGAADEYLESPAYSEAVFNSDPNDLGFKIQGIWMMNTLNVTPGTSARTAPTLLGLPPWAAVSNAVTIPVCLPSPASTSIGASGLLGVFTPGETRYFSLKNSVPPVRIIFPTTDGPTTVIAHPSVVWWDPLRYQVKVPDNVTTGYIYVTDVRAYEAIQIGQVMPTFP